MYAQIYKQPKDLDNGFDEGSVYDGRGYLPDDYLACPSRGALVCGFAEKVVRR